MSYNEWILNKLSVKFWSSPYIVQKGLWAQRNHGVVPLLTFPKLPAEGAEDISLPAQLSRTLSIPACLHARSPNPYFIYNVKRAFLPPTKVTCCPLTTSGSRHRRLGSRQVLCTSSLRPLSRKRVQHTPEVVSRLFPRGPEAKASDGHWEAAGLVVDLSTQEQAANTVGWAPRPREQKRAQQRLETRSIL